jgi:hypothetical protein
MPSVRENKSVPFIPASLGVYGGRIAVVSVRRSATDRRNGLGGPPTTKGWVRCDYWNYRRVSE